ncbi:MAG: hypothetical protein ACTH31_07725 [Pseudoclavibacter sp.]
MPKFAKRHRRRTIVIAASGTVVVALTAIATLFATGYSAAFSSSGARAAAAEYADLLARADEAALEQLLAMSADPGDDERFAGQVLINADERIDVAGIGMPRFTNDLGAIPADSALALDEAVSVSIRYRLAGETHDDTIVLAPIAGAPQGDGSSWRIVTHLAGTVHVPYERLTSRDHVADMDLSGTELPVTTDSEGSDVFIFAGVYAGQTRMDEYLASEISQVTVTPGDPVEFAPMEMDATEATHAALQADSDRVFGDCQTDVLACPFDLVDEGSWVVSPDDWSAELITAPSVTLDGQEVVLEGGEMLVASESGHVTLSFAGRAPWAIDTKTLEPALRSTSAELDVEATRA